MRNRSRLMMLLAPWWAALAREATAQPNTNTPSGGPGREQGEVQVGAGTQGDVTTGSSGTKAKKSKESGAGKGGKNDNGGGSAAAAGDGDKGTARTNRAQQSPAQDGQSVGKEAPK